MVPYSRLFSCGFNFRTAGAGRKLDFEKKCVSKNTPPRGPGVCCINVDREVL